MAVPRRSDVAAADTTSGLVVVSAADSTGTLTGVDATLDTGDASRDDLTKEATRASRLAHAAGSMLRRGGGGGGGLDGAALSCMRLMRSAVVGAKVAKTFLRGTVVAVATSLSRSCFFCRASSRFLRHLSADCGAFGGVPFIVAAVRLPDQLSLSAVRGRRTSNSSGQHLAR